MESRALGQDSRDQAEGNRVLGPDSIWTACGRGVLSGGRLRGELIPSTEERSRGLSEA